MQRFSDFLFYSRRERLLDVGNRQPHNAPGIEQPHPVIIKPLLDQAHPGPEFFLQGRILGAGEEIPHQNGKNGVTKKDLGIPQTLGFPAQDFAGFQVGDGGQFMLHLLFEMFFLVLVIEDPGQNDAGGQDDENQPEHPGRAFIVQA